MRGEGGRGERGSREEGTVLLLSGPGVPETLTPVLSAKHSAGYEEPEQKMTAESQDTTLSF